MRVGIDARMIANSGIGTYLRNLIRNLPDVAAGDLEYVYFSDPELFKASDFNFAVMPFSEGIYTLREQLGYLSRVNKVDVWHAPHFNIPLKAPKRLIVTVHDLIPYIFAGRIFSPMKKAYIEVMLRQIKKKAARVIAVSEHTKQDLMRLFQIPEERIRVTYEAASDDFKVIEDARTLETFREEYELPKEGFILYVGMIKPHKNIAVLIEAVRALRREGKIQQKLVIIGAKDKSYPVGYEYLERLQTDDDIIYLNRVGFGVLPALYNLADLFVLPSLYEGFGLPVLEAFASGTPVIVSNRASLPEVAGNAAPTFEAESAEDLSEKIYALLSNPDRLKDYRERGLRRAAEFSWRRMGQETANIYREVLD